MDFYKQLYKQNGDLLNKTLIASKLKTLNLPKIKAEQSKLLEAETTEAEFFTALCNMGKNKSPGLDGFPAEFYITFWDNIKCVYMAAWRHTVNTGRLSASQSEAVVTLLPKAYKDHLQPGNFRPITLLNVDYKIASKVVNTRIRGVLNDIISPAQNGFIPKRYIGTNIRLLFDIIDCADYYDIPGAILSLDMFKAFDTVNWDFIYTALAAFGDKIIK